MMGVTHMAVGVLTTSLGLQTQDPTLLLTGAISTLLPDIDISTSPAGRVCPWVARFLESKFPHRSCTHSFVASAVVALIAYPAVLVTHFPSTLAHSITLGYFAGWFLDIFTKNGVEMFWPSSVRWVCPANRNFRLATNSRTEYGLLVLIVAACIISFHVTSNGGVITQFNRFLASTTGVEQIYNEKGATHLMIAHIKGVFSSDRTPVNGDFQIIQAHGQGFIVRDSSGRIYKAGTESDVQILTQSITADPGTAATTRIEPLRLDDQELGEALQPFNRPGVLVFISGQLQLDEPFAVTWIPDPAQFPMLKVMGGLTIIEAFPLELALSQLGEQFATGQLSIRSIYTNAQAPAPSNS